MVGEKAFWAAGAGNVVLGCISVACQVVPGCMPVVREKEEVALWLHTKKRELYGKVGKRRKSFHNFGRVIFSLEQRALPQSAEGRHSAKPNDCPGSGKATARLTAPSEREP